MNERSFVPSIFGGGDPTTTSVFVGLGGVLLLLLRVLAVESRWSPGMVVFGGTSGSGTGLRARRGRGAPMLMGPKLGKGVGPRCNGESGSSSSVNGIPSVKSSE